MDWLTVFKFAGILVSGALGVLGTLTETRNRNTHKLTTWGRYALCLTIAGFAVAFAAQITETSKQREEAVTAQHAAEIQIGEVHKVLRRLQEQNLNTSVILTNVQAQNTYAQSQIKTAKDLLQSLTRQSEQNKTILTNLEQQSVYAQTQIALATNSLSGIEKQGVLTSNALDGIAKVITKFDDISVSFCYELPYTNAIIANLRRFCHLATGTNPPLLAFTKIANPNFPFSSDNPDSEGQTERFECRISDLLPLLKSNTVVNEEVVNLLWSFTSPNVTLQFSKLKRAPQSLSDATYSFDRSHSLSLWYDTQLFTADRTTNVFLNYALPSERIAIVWKFYSWPRDKWKSTGSITSLHDVGSSYLYWHFAPDEDYREYSRDLRIDNVYSAMALRWSLLSFDNFGITILSNAFKVVDQVDFRFAPTDFMEVSSLVEKLTRRSDDVSKFVATRLTPGTMELLSEYSSSRSNAPDVTSALAREFNALIAGPSIYERERFARTMLRPKTEQFLARTVHNQDCAALNRSLLDDAYPELLGSGNVYEGLMEVVLPSEDEIVSGRASKILNPYP